MRGAKIVCNRCRAESTSFRQKRPLREIFCMQRCPSRQRGATSELAWCCDRVAPASPLVSLLYVRSLWLPIAQHQPASIAAALRLPDGSLLRKPPAGSSPCGRLKPFCTDTKTEKQNPNHPNHARPANPRHQICTDFWHHLHQTEGHFILRFSTPKGSGQAPVNILTFDPPQ